MEEDSWHILKKFTNARIALGHAGNSLPTKELLQFKMAHALAKDAVYCEMDLEGLKIAFDHLKLQTLSVQSQATEKEDYLRNPDKGRFLDTASKDKLLKLIKNPVDLCIIIADGLSADAVNQNAVNLVAQLFQKLKNWAISPVILAKYSRVALSDQIGETLDAKIACILIGERPGLSTPCSMGAYLTFRPQTGNTDEKRNCISNIQPEGLSLESATDKIVYLIHQMKMKEISGVPLKNDFLDMTQITD